MNSKRGFGWAKSIDEPESRSSAYYRSKMSSAGGFGWAKSIDIPDSSSSAYSRSLAKMSSTSGYGWAKSVDEPGPSSSVYDTSLLPHVSLFTCLFFRMQFCTYASCKVLIMRGKNLICFLLNYLAISQPFFFFSCSNFLTMLFFIKYLMNCKRFKTFRKTG